MRFSKIVTCLFILAAQQATASENGQTPHECLLEPNQRVELRSPVDAPIKQISVDRGSRVNAGQTLVELESGVESAALEAAAYRSTMEGETKTAKAKLDYAAKKLQRREQLVKGDYISAQERDDSFAEMRLAEVELIQARDNRQLASLEQKRLREALRLRTIKAPFAGIVTERLQQPGEQAFAGGSGTPPILKLAQTDPLRVEAILPLALYGKISPGSKAQIVPEPPLAGSWQATVKIVDSVVDSASGTFGVRLELPNPKHLIPAGVKCQVFFAGKE